MDHPNLCVVGDPDQSIYRWRGSDIRNILDFERDYPGAEVVTLSENYRSTKNILASASALIAHNRGRKPKPLHTAKAEGSKVTILEFPTSHDESEGLARRIKAAVADRGREYRDIAIFLRMNALSRGLEAALIKHRIPYQIVRGLAFFERKENKDILAYLRLLLNPRDDLSFLRVVNEPARGIGKTSLEHLKDYAAPRGLSLLEAAAQADKIDALRGKAAQSLGAFAQLIGELHAQADAPPDVMIKEVLDRSGYKHMLEKSKEGEDQERLANVEELITAAQEFAAVDDSNTLEGFLEHVTLVSDQDALDSKQNRVSIMTLHAAKGLEFPVVFMPALEQGILPHERSSQNRDELEEERRLTFVGITRAQEELTLSYAQMREYRGRTMYSIPSPFLDELPRGHVQRIHVGMDERETVFGPPHEAAANDQAPLAAAAIRQHKPAWQGPAGQAPPPTSTAPRFRGSFGGRPDEEKFVVGASVRHKDYGPGQIKEVTGFGAQRRVKISFSTVGEKTFILAKAPLELLSN